MRPLAPGAVSSAYATSLVADADDDARERPGSISFAKRPCDAGRLRPRVGEPGRDEDEEWGEDGAIVSMVGIGSDIAVDYRATVFDTQLCLGIREPLRVLPLRLKMCKICLNGVCCRRMLV